MDDASHLPQLNCKSRPSPAIPAPTQNQGKRRQEMSSGTAKVTSGRKATNKIRTGALSLLLLGEGHLGKGHQLGSLHNGPERSTWASHSNSSGCLKPLVSLQACQATGSHANLDIKMHEHRFKWQKEVRVTDQGSFSIAHPWWKSAGLEANSESPRRECG